MDYMIIQNNYIKYISNVYKYKKNEVTKLNSI